MGLEFENIKMIRNIKVIENLENIMVKVSKIFSLTKFQGQRFWPDGRRYRGAFFEGKMEGQGEFTWPTNKIGIRIVYTGGYKNNYKDGIGTLEWRMKDP